MPIDSSDTADSEAREARTRLMAVLEVIDSHMARTRDASIGWAQISFGLGLASTSGLTTTEIAEEFDVTKQAVGKGTVNFLRMVRLEPAWGLKSERARSAMPLTVNRHVGAYDSNPGFNDAANWESASYEDHPVNSLEPTDVPLNAYREEARRGLQLLRCWTPSCQAHRISGLPGA